MQKSIVEDLFLHELRVLTNAEHKIADKLKQATRKIPAGPTQDIINQQLEVSQTRAEQLAKIGRNLDAGGGFASAACFSMNAILEEIEKAQKANLDPEALQAEMVLGIQRIKQYQLVGYRSVQRYATALRQER